MKVTFSGKPMAECWFDDACILDMDYFVKTLSSIKAKGVRPELVGSIITHYASKWLPDITGSEESIEKGLTNFQESLESATATWMKKRFMVETLIGILPAEKDSIPCNFLLRLLRISNMVGVEGAYREELEKRVSGQLEQASLKEIMIPSFSHTCGTLLDVELVLRLVKRFVSLDEAVRCGASLVKVAKLLDNYLAEAAVDSNLSMPEFVALATAIPSHARATDDGLYRAIDTYLKAHPGVTKEERKRVCKLIDSRKLSADASIHASQNDRLPVRAVIQVLLSEQTKLSKHLDWSGSFSGTRSPNMQQQQPDQYRCMSKRADMNIQQLEIKKLKEEVLRLQSQCMNMQAQIDRLLVDNSSSRNKRPGGGGGFFSSWKKLGVLHNKNNKLGEVDGDSADVGFGRQTPVDIKARLVRGRTSTKWRKSLS